MTALGILDPEILRSLPRCERAAYSRIGRTGTPVRGLSREWSTIPLTENLHAVDFQGGSVEALVERHGPRPRI